MTPQAPWSPTAHAFAHHQFSHVANFWKQGREASFRLEALPGGQAELNLTFQLPPASEVVPPPSHVPPFPAPQRPIHPLFPNGYFPQRSCGADSKTKYTSQKQVSSRRRKSYHRSVLHKAALAAPSLPPPKYGSLRQAAQACVQQLQAVSALPVNTPSAKKRPFSDSPSTLSPSNPPPLAQRIRSDLKIGEESPEREFLRNEPSPVMSPLSSPYVNGLPLPAPLAFTPTPSSPVNVKSFPPPALLAFTPSKDESQAFEVVKAGAAIVLGKESSPAPLPLCHYCCHKGSGLHQVHYYLQCLCSDKVCSCQCYCTEMQLEHKKVFFPSGFSVKCVEPKDRPKARTVAEARANRLDFKGLPMANRPCEDENCVLDHIKL